MIVLLLLGCASAPVAPAPPTHLADCDAEPAPELKVLCTVQVAADRARARDFDEADLACDGVPAGVWQEECHFRAGEELSKAGDLEHGLHLCQEAGRFRTYCFTHSAWGVPPSDAPLVDFETAGAGFSDVQGVENLRARWWFNHYFGTGKADAADAKAAPAESLGAARGAWALEAVRLADGDLDKARAAWDGAPLTGEPLPPDRRLGHYDLPFDIPEEKALPDVPGFGGSRRLLGESDAEDLDIALLEGAAFREATGADTFRPFLADPRPRVRYTAIRAFRTLPSDDAEAVLTAMQADPDPIVRAHVADALKYQTWKGKPNLPGLTKARPAGAPGAEPGSKEAPGAPAGTPEPPR